MLSSENRRACSTKASCILSVPRTEHANRGVVSFGLFVCAGAGWRRGVSQSLFHVPPRREQHIRTAAGGAAQSAVADYSRGAGDGQNEIAGLAVEPGGTQSGRDLSGQGGARADNSCFCLLLRQRRCCEDRAGLER